MESEREIDSEYIYFGCGIKMFDGGCAMYRLLLLPMLLLLFLFVGFCDFSAVVFLLSMNAELPLGFEKMKNCVRCQSPRTINAEAMDV